jgi:hypothetical protein
LRPHLHACIAGGVLDSREVCAVFEPRWLCVLDADSGRWAPGYSRPMIRAEDYRRLLEASTYSGDRVRL